MLCGIASITKTITATAVMQPSELTKMRILRAMYNMRRAPSYDFRWQGKSPRGFHLLARQT